MTIRSIPRAGQRHRVLLLAAAAVSLAAWNGDGCTKSTATVIWVHGYEGSGTSGINLESQFRTAIEHFRAQGWKEKMYVVSYYEGDVSWSDASLGVSTLHLNTGGPGDCAHETHHASGHVGGAACAGVRAHTTQTRIEHLGYHLAWKIYDTFTTENKEVRIMAHSMGGLITRYAMKRVREGHSAFPPVLNIGAVATFGTPHDGATFAEQCTVFACPTQLEQMNSGNGFLEGLGDSLPNGSVLNSPEWWLYAAQDDDLVGVASALHPSGAYEIEYPDGQAIEHDAFFDRVSTTKNYDCFFNDAFAQTCAGPMYSAQRRLSEKQCVSSNQCPDGQSCLSGVCQK